jgi:hypothetical protein
MAKLKNHDTRFSMRNARKPINDENRMSIIKKTSRAFSGWPMILVWLAMLIFACHACTHMVAAGDTWVAMACGRHFVKHGVDTVEPFSANSHKAGPTLEEIKTWPNWAQWITGKVGIETVKKWHPTGWINQNWLTHEIFYSLTTSLGSEEDPLYNALVYWKFAIYILSIIIIFYSGVLLGANPVISAVFSCFALFIGRSFLDIRPAGFSNLLVATFIFILILTTYRNVLFIWLIVPLTVFWCNVHGGYIYVFIMLIPFTGLHLLTCFNKKWTAILYNVTAWPFYFLVVSRAGLHLATFLFLILLVVLDITLIFYKASLITIKWKGVFHTIAAGIIAFLAMVLLNPFHLTNLTHTFVISVSEHAARWRDIHEWQPAFDWDNPVGTAIPFAVMYAVAWTIFILWILVPKITSRTTSRERKKKIDTSDQFQRPKIDLSLMIIAALTIYMALRSRRFIPIAAFAACPIIAMLVDQVIRGVTALHNLRKNNRLFVSAMPSSLQLIITFAGAAAVIFFGTWWGLKFKHIYLDPWPSDTNPKLCTVFMRMTASDAKPFEAGRFIRENKLKGKMFNYWTEGGFIAWAEQPDPNTGKIPLQLFMDGRAQAAYDRKAFDLWSAIMSGGRITAEIIARAEARGQRVSSSDYVKIGRWMDEQLKENNVWIVLMPVAIFGEPIPDEYYVQKSHHAIKGLEYNRNWPVVFLNDKQKIFVDYTTAQGRELYDGIQSGKTLYPDDYHKNLIVAHTLLQSATETANKELELSAAIDAFNEASIPAPMLEILLAGSRFPELKPKINDFCKGYIDSFIKSEETYSLQNGYRMRVEAARLACIFLSQNAQEQNDKKLADFYATKAIEYANERNRAFKKW